MIDYSGFANNKDAFINTFQKFLPGSFKDEVKLGLYLVD